MRSTRATVIDVRWLDDAARLPTPRGIKKIRGEAEAGQAAEMNATIEKSVDMDPFLIRTV
jgi:predicted solute-binding protein